LRRAVLEQRSGEPESTTSEDHRGAGLSAALASGGHSKAPRAATDNVMDYRRARPAAYFWLHPWRRPLDVSIKSSGQHGANRKVNRPPPQRRHPVSVGERREI
jgi:hypothetical protein